MENCCPPDSIPFLEEDPNYVPQGEMINYNGVHAYCIGNGKKCLIFLHDIFGLNSGMNKQHCDTLAKYLADYVVVAPDFFPTGNILGDDPLKERGSAIIPKLIWPLCCCKLFGFLQRHSWDNSSGDIFNKTTEYFLSEKGVESFALLGFCWGSYIAFKACGEANHRIRILCNLSCHPSVHSLAGRFNEKEIDIVERVNCPQFVAATKNEPSSWKPGGEIQSLLSKKAFAQHNEFVVYDQMSHGFVTRGDTKDKATREAIQDCLTKIIHYLHKF